MAGRKKATTQSDDAVPQAQPSGADGSLEQVQTNGDSQPSLDQLNPLQQADSHAEDDQKPYESDRIDVGGDLVGSVVDMQNCAAEQQGDNQATSDAPKQDDVQSPTSVKPIVVTSHLSHRLAVPPTYLIINAGETVEIVDEDDIKRDQIIRNLQQLKLSFKDLHFSY